LALSSIDIADTPVMCAPGESTSSRMIVASFS